jgi:probable F420-dependent oxidoreductase
MKIGLSIHRLHRFGYDPAAYATIARKAEEVGFDSLWMGDHLVFPATLPPTYPYSPDGRGPHEPSLPWLDPLVTLTYLAAATERLRLATDVYILPLRDPFVTAKAVATLDILSRGRVTLGVGVGWLEPEYVAVGRDFHNRGRRCDELVEALKALWTQETIRFRGRYYDFGPVKFEPKPVQKPHPPIHYGGISPAALRRAAEECDGWIGVPQPWEDLAASLDQIRALRRRSGRDHLPFEVTAGPPGPPTLENLRRCEALGIHRVTVGPWMNPAARVTVQRACEEMERFAETVLSKIGT